MVFAAYKLVEKIAIISQDFSRKFGFSLNWSKRVYVICILWMLKGEKYS